MTPAKKHNVEEIVSILRDMQRLTEDEGMSVSGAAQSLGITDQTFYRWRARYGSLPEDEAKRLQLLDDENARLKRVITEQAQDISMLQDLTQGEIPSAAGRREAVEYLMQYYRISERRACRLLGQHRSTQRYGGTGRGESAPMAGSPMAVTDTGVPVQGWRPATKEEHAHGALGSDLLEPPRVEGQRGETSAPSAPPPRIPFLDDRIPCLYRLRTSLVHDLRWLARDSDMARLVRTYVAIRPVENLATTPHGLVHLLRGHEETSA